MKTSTGTSAARYQYGYDQDSQVLDRNDLVETALSELYHANSSTSGDNATAYDALGRLTGFARGTLSASGHNGASLDTIASPSATQSWNLDAVGNQTGVTTNGTTVNQTFNTLNQPASTASGFSTNYDADGNTLVSGHFSLTYDAWNRLVSVRSSLSGAVAASYSYDSLGNRITETDAAGTTTDLYYNADGQVIEERLGSQALGNVHYQSVYGSTGNLILRDTYAGGSIVPSARLYALTDANGDITALTDPSGTVVERYEYSPYGAVTVLDASGTPRTGNVSAYGWQYLFQGGRLDGTTGLYRFGARDYDPSNGVWMQRDPIGLAAGQQDLYGFVGNDPVVDTDATGLYGELESLYSQGYGVGPVACTRCHAINNFGFGGRSDWLYESPYTDRTYVIPAYRDQYSQVRNDSLKAYKGASTVYTAVSGASAIKGTVNGFGSLMSSTSSMSRPVFSFAAAGVIPAASSLASSLSLTGTSVVAAEGVMSLSVASSIQSAGENLSCNAPNANPILLPSTPLRQVRFGDGLRHALQKHLAGNGPVSLKQLDPGGNSEKWLAHIIKTAQSGAGTVKSVPTGEVMEIIAPMAKEAGGGVLNVGVRLFRATGETSWRLTTLLTRQ